MNQRTVEQSKGSQTKSPQTVRCAIYTRKSTEEGLDQDFNSLDAQRESAEAYVASQKGEGWQCIETRYDDGGFTGGNLERPGMNRLSEDIAAGLIDCVIVYKVDRLSRSLMDFTRIMEMFDKHNVSFVSVTQQFNTTSSMGRLTLNILLSFAQFEREIISERTRDKMAAARRRGKYIGGAPILGYDIDRKRRRLIINEPEAKRVRKIFELYLDKQSLMATITELDQRGWNTKKWITKKGVSKGGNAFNKSRLHHLLRNVTYIGKVKYKEEIHEGEHEGIIDPELFQNVQTLLKNNRMSGTVASRNQGTALLKGLLHCQPCGCPMYHTYTSKNRQKRYSYYVCTRAQKRGWHNCPSKSIPAAEIEAYVVNHVRMMGRDEELIRLTIESVRNEQIQARAKLESDRSQWTTNLRTASNRMQILLKDPTSLDPSRLADLQEQIQQAETHLRNTNAAIDNMRGQIISDDQITQALHEFDALWDSLSLNDRSRILNLLIERVEYNGAESTVSISFRPDGIENLIEDHSHEEILV